MISHRSRRVLTVIGGAVAALVFVSACSLSSDDDKSSAHQANKAARANVQQINGQFKDPQVKNFTDYQNFYKAQQTYDNPNTIVWCTFTWGNSNSPLVTVPVKSKLTSSSVSLFPTQQVKSFYDNDGTYNPELPSSDAMYHGSPAPYRYGFTPGGQYVDFFNLPTFCTTQLTKFQRQSSKVSVTNDDTAEAAQKAAESALAICNKGQSTTAPKTNACPAAQEALESALGGGGN